MKVLLFLSAVLSFVKPAFSQDSLRYVDAASLTMRGKAKTTILPYQRIDSTETREMPAVVQGLAKRFQRSTGRIGQQARHGLSRPAPAPYRI